MLPRITVIIRTHNSEDFVKKALDSAMHQTILDDLYEIIVVDDGSDDNTIAVLRGFQHKLKVIKKRKLGPVRAANLGFQSARGTYAILLDADDTFEPNALEEMLHAIETNKVDFVCCNYTETGLETGESKKVLLSGNIFNTVAAGILFKRTVLEKMNYYNEALIFPEYDLLIRLLKCNYSYTLLPNCLYTYFRHHRSLTSDKDLVRKGKLQLSARYGEIPNLREY
jgi:glycosyltransferase involved in cell wall biosynthesis